MGVFNRVKGENPPLNDNFTKTTYLTVEDQTKGQHHPGPSVTSSPFYTPLFLLNPIKKCRTAPLSSSKTNKQKTQTTEQLQHQLILTWKRKLLQEVSILNRDPNLTRLGAKRGGRRATEPRKKRSNCCYENKICGLYRSSSLPARLN